MAGGLHQRTLSGTAAATATMQARTWLVLDNACTARSISETPPVDNAIPLRTLAWRRARAVRPYLRRRGVRMPINVVGAGPVDPVDTTQQQLNRRVVIILYY